MNGHEIARLLRELMERVTKLEAEVLALKEKPKTLHVPKKNA